MVVFRSRNTLLARKCEVIMVMNILFLIAFIVFQITQENNLKTTTTTTDTEIPCQPEMKKILMKLPQNKFPGKYEYFYYVKMSTLKAKKNKARIGDGTCLSEKMSINPLKLEMIAITNFIPVDLLRHTLLMYNERPATNEEEEARISEMLFCIQENLNHPNIKSLYIFVEFHETMLYLHSVNFSNSEKLVIHWVNGTLTVKLTTMYISKCLQGHTVAILNQDNRLGAGFDKVPPSILINNKIMYALTRHPSYNNLCYYSSLLAGATCDPAFYHGSHDAFIFHVREFSEIAMDVISKVDHQDTGMENMFIWMFRKKLGYKVTNPCFVLYVHHHHCVPIRRKGRKRVNNATTAAQAGFTDKLT